ncbi:MAG: hypothetical protein FWE91_08415 [Defluviitaleaceae bacterium]|nr:hypothetical protein [Defluviitaleaceae bacterium]MCL2835289.1 hypothetical protein [Defluviitaleaceae bacterium]
MARTISKTITIEERNFIVKKYPAMDGLKVVKVFIAKILPVFQNFMPLVAEAQKSGVHAEAVLSNLGDYLSLDTIAETLDKVAPADFDYIMQKSLQNAFELLPAGEARVLNPDGTYGVLDVEHDPLLVLRLLCEVIMWSIGDFFDGKRLTSIMSPLSSSFPRTQPYTERE